MGMWFYEADGARRGPHFADELLSFANAGDLDANTLCWNDAFGPTWKRFADTGLREPTSSNPSPPPLPGAAVKDSYVWLYAMVPLEVGLLDLFDSNSANPTPMWFAIVACIAAYYVLAVADTRRLRRSGNLPEGKGIPAGWVFIAPVYLWKRASLLKKPKTTFWFMLGTLVVSYGMTYAAETGQVIMTEKPSCNSKYAKMEAMSIFNTIPAVKVNGVAAISIDNVSQVSEGEGARACHGTVTTSADTQIGLAYRFSKENGKTMVHVLIDGFAH